MDRASGTEPDLTGNGHTGTYPNGTKALAALPNGDQAADFDGASQYLTVSSSAVFSIPTTGNLTWEGWIRPDVLQFPHDDGVDRSWDGRGRGKNLARWGEGKARLYSMVPPEPRRNRLSAYVFNPSGNLGSSADWQPAPGVIAAGAWYHVVGEYTTLH